MYGHTIQDDPGDVLCAGCLRPQEAVDDAVLLCDGPGCGREYHLRCCDPPVDDIPTGNWYCQDCSKEGTTQLLREYLESSDERRGDFTDSAAYVRTLVERDMKDYREQRIKEGHNKVSVRKPVSELLRSRELHAAIRGLTAPASHGEEAGWDLLGKVIRLYDRLSNHYHSGRLVDFRVSLPCGTIEYLARFPAGIDGRKTTLLHWIVPEEHCLAVESLIVWAAKGNRYVPGQHYLRTARELVSVQHLYSDRLGQIVFEQPSGLIAASQVLQMENKEDSAQKVSATETPTSPRSPRSKRKMMYGLIRLFGEEEFLFLSLNTDVHLYGDAAHEEHGRYQEVKILTSLAEGERAEQEDVRRWKLLQDGDNWGPKAMSKADQHALSPLLLHDVPEFPSHMVPSIPQGLDRLYILRHMKKRGIEVSKSAGASLVCSEVPVQIPQYERERFC